MATSRLALAYIAASQASKEVTANADFDQIDARFDNAPTVSLSSGDGSVTLATLQSCFCITGSGASVARNLTLAAFTGERWVINSGTAEVTVKIGSTSIVLPPKSIGLFYGDGTTNGLSLLAGPFANAQGSFGKTTLTGDTSGTAVCYQPKQATADKEVIIYLDNYKHAGTAQFYTFPTAFTNVPYVVIDVEPVSTVIVSKVTLANTMAAGVTGWIILKGF